MPRETPEPLLHVVKLVLDAQAVLADDLLACGSGEDGVLVFVPKLFGAAAVGQLVHGDGELPRFIGWQVVACLCGHLDGVLAGRKDAGVHKDGLLRASSDTLGRYLFAVKGAGHSQARRAGRPGDVHGGAQGKRLDALAQRAVGPADGHPPAVDCLGLAGGMRPGLACIVNGAGPVGHGAPVTAYAVGLGQAVDVRELRPTAAIHAALVPVACNGAVGVGGGGQGDGCSAARHDARDRDAAGRGGRLVGRNCTVVRDREFRVQDKSGRHRVGIVVAPVARGPIRLHATDDAVAVAVRRARPSTGGGPVEIDHFRSPARIIGEGNAVVCHPRLTESHLADGQQEHFAAQSVGSGVYIGACAAAGPVRDFYLLDALFADVRVEHVQERAVQPRIDVRVCVIIVRAVPLPVLVGFFHPHPGAVAAGVVHAGAGVALMHDQELARAAVEIQLDGTAYRFCSEFYSWH